MYSTMPAMRDGRNRIGALRSLMVIGLLAACLRAFVPVGYMVSVVDGRLALTACSGVFSAGQDQSDIFSVAAGHDHHAGHAPAAGESDSGDPADQADDLANCPFAASGRIVLADIVAVVVPPSSFRVLNPAPLIAAAEVFRVSGHRPRAPPAIS